MAAGASRMHERTARRASRCEAGSITGPVEHDGSSACTACEARHHRHTGVTVTARWMDRTEVFFCFGRREKDLGFPGTGWKHPDVVLQWKTVQKGLYCSGRRYKILTDMSNSWLICQTTLICQIPLVSGSNLMQMVWAGRPSKTALKQCSNAVGRWRRRGRLSAHAGRQ